DRRFSYIIPNFKRGYHSLGDESFFWNWNPKDGYRPSKIQFRLTIIQESELYWSNILSPVLELRDNVYKPPEDMLHELHPCYKNSVVAKNGKHFVISDNQTELIINKHFLEELYPELRETEASSTEITTNGTTESMEKTITPATEISSTTGSEATSSESVKSTIL
ncbi:unnamed protein product, partial [Allacma fusca]